MSDKNFVQEDNAVVVYNQPVAIDLNDASEKLIAFTDKLCSSVTTWKEIDLQMHQMDLQFNAYIAGVEADYAKFKRKMPVVEKQLDEINKNMGKLLDRALEMDAETELEIKMKLRYLDMVEKYMDNLSAVIMQML